MGHLSSLVFTVDLRPAVAAPSTPTSMMWWESWRDALGQPGRGHRAGLRVPEARVTLTQSVTKQLL